MDIKSLNQLLKGIGIGKTVTQDTKKFYNQSTATWLTIGRAGIQTQAL